MQILGPNIFSSHAFVVSAGKQVTLSAQGLAAGDVVHIEIVTLSAAPAFTGNPCCDLLKANIEVISAVPLKCPDGSAVTMTAEYPFVVLDGPQMVTMRARVQADAAATITVDLNESDSDGCTLCACRTTPCEDTTWTPTGDERCVGTNVEHEETSNCGNSRWVVDRAVAWTDTGDTRCTATEVEKEQINDCGKTRWTTVGPLTWTATGQERCVGTDVEREEQNDCCCTKRWVFDRAQVWTDTGDTRCTATDVEKEQINDCGKTKWVVSASLAWTPTGQERCVGTNVEREEENDCGAPRWVVDRAVAWTDTGETRCANNVVEVQQENDCGKTRWTPTATTCGYCPSLRISCDGQPGFGFHTVDPKDPAATVEMVPCPGDDMADSIWIYPSAGPGHTIKVAGCDGTLIGYAVNKSDCAGDCGCPKDPVINVTNNFAPTTNVAAPEVNITQPAPNLVAQVIADDGTITSTLSDGTTVVSNPLPSC